MKDLSRRSLLKGSAVAAGAAATLSFGELFHYSDVFAQGSGDDPQTILNLAVTAETFACVHYYNVLKNVDALKLTADEQRNIRTFLDAEFKHKQFLESNGAKALATSFYAPPNLWTDRTTFVTTSDTAESWFVAAYLAAVRRFAELNQMLLAATSAQVMGVEAEHQALIRQMGGMVPSNRTLKQALFYNTSEVAPLFKPFLEGGNGFAGPVAYPGDDAINTAVADQGTIATTPFTSLTNGMGTMSATAEATAMTGACTVAGNNVNIRKTPDTMAEVSGALTKGTPLTVTGQTMDSSGITWYQVQGGWVRSDVVTVSGDCSAVAFVAP